jgi:prephenate dehydratase
MQNATPRIAIQGEPGSFSHQATLGFFPQATIVPCSFSPEVFRLVMDGQVEAAVIPIENSLAGSVLEHYDLLLANDVLVEQEALLRIRHNLIAVPGSDLSKVRRVYSHPIALAQCRRFFADHPEMEAVPFYDTAGSVKQATELRDPSVAGIASAQAAVQYQGQILAANIEDSAENFTRFFVMRKREQADANPDANKVSLAFTVENRPGTLIEALQTFAGLGTNLTKIESRPVHGKPWEYVFYVDYQVSDPATADKAISLLTGQCSMVKELGRYKAAELS